MGLVKNILGIGCAIVVGGTLLTHIAREASLDLRYLGADSKEYNLIESSSMSRIKFQNDPFKTTFPILHDTNHDGTPDVVQVKQGIIGGGTPGSMGIIYTATTRPPTQNEIDWYKAH